MATSQDEPRMCAKPTRSGLEQGGAGKNKSHRNFERVNQYSDAGKLSPLTIQYIEKPFRKNYLCIPDRDLNPDLSEIAFVRVPHGHHGLSGLDKSKLDLENLENSGN
uniref:Uncharacterized protein n=1 Tax=Timema poppense TaxID=170557 RepID=A0A7R9CL45_TIMPO|nr:unnamed protein product [Timema poppensis]